MWKAHSAQPLTAKAALLLRHQVVSDAAAQHGQRRERAAASRVVYAASRLGTQNQSLNRHGVCGRLSRCGSRQQCCSGPLKVDRDFVRLAIKVSVHEDRAQCLTKCSAQVLQRRVQEDAPEPPRSC